MSEHKPTTKATEDLKKYRRDGDLQAGSRWVNAIRKGDTTPTSCRSSLTEYNDVVAALKQAGEL